MAYLKLYNAFTHWADSVAAAIHSRYAEAHALVTAHRALAARKARRVIASWRRHAERCHRGRLLLEATARHTAERQRGGAFAAWRTETLRRKDGVEALTVRCAASRDAAGLQWCLTAWQSLTQDWHGGRTQLAHAVRVLDRARGVRAVCAWQERASHAQQVHRAVTLGQQDREQRVVGAALAAWQEFAWSRAEHRHVFVRY
jgi:hypothetical protein